MTTETADISPDWSWTVPQRPVHPTTLDGAGINCETKRFDCFYNPAGDPVLLPAGQRYQSQRDADYESALVVTTFWDRTHNTTGTSLTIRSPHMKAAIKNVVPEYRDYNINARHIQITGDPRCLFLYRNGLYAYGAGLPQTDQDSDAAQHLQHLIQYMWDVFATESAALTIMEFTDDTHSLQHSYLWMIFRPGDLIYVRQSPGAAFLLTEMSISGSTWFLTGHRVSYDGHTFGYQEYSTSIPWYDGFRRIAVLPAVEFGRLPEPERETVRERLVARGRKFVGIHGVQYLWYSAERDKTHHTKVRQTILKSEVCST